MHRVLAIATITVVSAAASAASLDAESDAFMSGLYVCRIMQKDPVNLASALAREAWTPSRSAPGGYEKASARMFQSPDQSACHVQTTQKIDLERLQNWLELTGALDGQVKRFAWDELRTRPLRNDTYRIWSWESWRSAGGDDPGALSHEIVVLPGAAQSRPGEKSATATISYRAKR